jgi:hypothetical protein
LSKKTSLKGSFIEPSSWITGVVPDEPVFLEITRREQVEELLSVVRGILMESLLSLTLLDAKIKGSDWGRDALKHLKNY